MGVQSRTKLSVLKKTATLSRGPRTIYIIAFLDLFAVSMLMPLLRKRTLDLGCSFTVAGLIGSVYGAAQLMSSPFIGDWSDRFGRTKIMLLTSVLASVGYLTLAVSFWIPLLFVSRVICGSFKHTQTLCKAYLADLEEFPVNGDCSPQKSHSRENENFGNFMTYSTLGFVVGPIVGGHIADGPNGFLIVSAVVAGTFLFNAALIHFFLPKVSETSTKRYPNNEKPFNTTVVQKTLMENADIFLLQLFVSFSVLVIRTNYVQHLEKNFGISVTWAGYITSYHALLGVAGSKILTKHSLMKHYENNSKLMLHTTVLIGIAVFGIAYSSNFVVYLLSSTILNFMTPFSRLANIRQLTERSHSSEHHGFLIGTSQSVGSFSRLSSSFLTGVGQDYFSVGPEVISFAFSSIAVFQILLKYY